MDTAWGWTSYKQLHWNDGKGHKLYEGKFRQANDLSHWTLQVVKFWASKPRKALSFICQSGKEPHTFANQIIN